MTNISGTTDHHPPEGTGQKQVSTKFKPGHSGNPKGRPRGSRNKIAEASLAALDQCWQEGGIEALRIVMKRSPEVFCKMVFSLLPREMVVQSLTASVNVDFAELAKVRGKLEAYRFAKSVLGGADLELEAEPVEGAMLADGWRVLD